MKVVKATLHFMVKALPKEEGITTGKAPDDAGTVKMPEGMKAALRGVPGQKWRTACGQSLINAEYDGMTLMAKMVNCEGCHATAEFKEAKERGR
jgi:hypothetical protein